MGWSRCGSCGLRFNDDRGPRCPKCGGAPAAEGDTQSSSDGGSALTREVGPGAYKVLAPIPALLGVAGIVLGVTQVRIGFIIVGIVFLAGAWKWWNGQRA